MGWNLNETQNDKLRSQLRAAITGTDAPLVTRIPTSKPERDSGQALVAPVPDESRSPGRVTVRITRLSCSLLDFDNGVGGCKFVIDAMRREGLIRNDDPASIDFEFRQKRVSTKAEQGTVIEIF